MTSFSGMITFEARLASFSKIVSQKRNSNLKGSKSPKWPHVTPTPASLAYAGFFYKPTTINPDTVECFLCHTNFEGWEPEDDPVTEHIDHSPECAFAILATLEKKIPDDHDPLSDKFISARTKTFESWPHTKRGWTCKPDVMVAAGMYFCPNKSSKDFAKCVYCGFGMGGWGPQTDPMREHQTNYPSCTFFLHSRSKPANSSSRSSSPRYMATTQASRARSRSTSSARSSSTKSTKTTKSDKSQLPNSSKPSPTAGWKPADFEKFLESIQVTDRGIDIPLSEYEKQMTMKDWVLHRAASEEARLDAECESRASFYDDEYDGAIIAALEKLPTSD